jgi:hypothetical protein
MGGPSQSGGNNPMQAAAMQRVRGGVISAGTDPNQLPQGQIPQGAGQGSGVGQLLAQALQLFVQGGANPADTEQIKQFFEQFVAIAEESQRDMASNAAVGGRPMGAGTAPAAPQPGPLPPSP